MDQHRARIVVGEGQTLRKGLLRFVLEGEGYDVVAEAGSSAELARMVAVHEPDVVVLDDGIGATAVQMARELAPKAKVILVWPGAVVPIGGDARVEPAEVLKELGGAVQKVTARPAPTEAFQKPAWVDRVRKDPATLRDLLEKSGGLPRRPSVTELQRRGQRLHPVGEPDEAGGERSPDDATSTDEQGPDEQTPDAPAANEPSRTEPPTREAAPDDADRPTAPVVILPVPGAGAGAVEPIVVVDTTGADRAVGTHDAGVRGEVNDERAPADGEADATIDAVTAEPAIDEDQRSRGAAVIAMPTATRAADAPDDAATEWNRRLGSIALGGAAVAGALVLALSLGGSRVPTDVLAANPSFPQGAEAPAQIDGDTGSLDPDGAPDPVPGAPTLSPAPIPPSVDVDVADRDDTTPPTQTPPTDEPEEPPGTPEPPQPPTPPPPPPPPGGNGGGNGGGGLPGASARNPHGGPPGITGEAPNTPAVNGGAGPGNGNGGPGIGNGGGNGNAGNPNPGGNGNAGGNGNGNGPPASPPGQARGGDAADRAAPSHAHKR